MPSVSSIKPTRTIIAYFLELLRSRGVDICVLRNYDGVFDESARDIDCIPALGQLRALEEAICAFAKEHGARLIVFRRHYVHSFHLMFRDGVLLTIDIIVKIQGWWGAAYLCDYEIWAGARKRGDFWIPRPAHEAAMAFFQHLLWGGFYKRKYVERLPLLIEEDEEEFRRILTERFGQRWLCLIDWIKQKDVARIEKRVSGLRKGLWANALKRDCQKTLSRFFLFMVREGVITLGKRGLFVVLIGPDGVGKTTLAGGLKAGWGNFFRDVLYFHFRPPLIGGLEASIPQGGEVQLRDLTLRPTFVARVLSPARLLISVARFNLGYWLRVFPALLHQNLVIADRYFYNYLLFPESVCYYGPRWLAVCCARVFPKPDLVFALYAPPDVIRRRKSELPECALTKQLDNLSSVCSIADMRLIDADRSLEEIVLACKSHVIEAVIRKSSQNVAGWEAEVKTPRLPGSILSRDSRQTSSSQTQRQQENLNDVVRVDGARWISFSTASGAQYVIPTNDRKVAAASLELYRPRKLLARAGKRLLSTALRFGMAQPLLRHYGNAHGITKGHRKWWEDAALQEQLERIFGVNKVSVSFLVGCPNDQKLVAQVMDQEANILGYLKIGCSPEAIEAIHHEESVLRHLQTHFFSTTTIPKVIYAGHWDNRYLLIQRPPSVRSDASPGRITYQHIAFLSELYGVVPQTQLAGNEFLSRIRQRVEKLEKLGYGSSVLPVLNVLEEFNSRVDETDIICGFMHGDFAPWNMLREQNRLFVFDWERAHTTSTPGWDLFHFIVQTGSLVHDLSAGEIYESIFGNGATHKCVDAYFREVGTPPQLIRLCLRLYIADIMSFHLCRSGESGGSKGERQRSTWRNLLALASLAEGV
jgi:thymidylate kinase